MPLAHDFPTFEDGATIRLPLGGPFRFICCDCELVHDLHTSITITGRVLLTVFRNDALTAQLREQRDRSSP